MQECECYVCKDYRAYREDIISLFKEITDDHADEDSHDYNACEVDMCKWCEDVNSMIVKLNAI